MSKDTPSPSESPLPSDAFDRLERMHELAKEQQAAWRKLLESLEAMKPKDPPQHQPDTETPSP